MAHFHKIPTNEVISAKPVTIARGSITVGLWGYIDPKSGELDVVSDSPGVVATKGKVRGDSREWVITAATSGRARIEARTMDLGLWDFFELTCTAAPTVPAGATVVSAEDRAEVFDALRTGKILGGGQLYAVEKAGKYNDGARDLVLADAMFPVLAALARGGPLELLSLMRFNEGPHGRAKTDDVAIGSAMDIKAYANVPINLLNGDNVENAIAGVVKVIDNLPPGKYALGLPRPSPRAKGPPMPKKDVFLPVDPPRGWPMPRVGFPLGNPTPQFVNPDAADAVNAALARNPRATFDRMFQDAPDHLHLEVISARSE